MAATLNTYLLPKRVTNLPLNGIVSNWPMGSASKMLPKPASVNCNEDLISGMRLAQLAKAKPWLKKKTDTAMRSCNLLYWLGNIAVVLKAKNERKNNSNDFRILQDAGIIVMNYFTYLINVK